MLDAGDVINGAGEYADIVCRYYEKALSYLHYDAVGIGEMEARHMKEYAKQTPFSSSVPTINANVLDAISKKPLAREPYVIKKTKNGLSVGIIAVLSEVLVDQFMQEKIGIRSTAAADALKQYVPRLRQKCDLIVVLFHGDPISAKALAKDVPDIDVLLNGHPTGMFQDTAEQIGKVVFMPTRTSGKYVGKIVLDIGADRKIAGFKSEYVPMDTSYADDVEMAKLNAQNDKDMEDYYARMRMQYARFTNDPSQPRSPQPFVAVNKCTECHAAERSSWNASGHARAFYALTKDSGKDRDPQCLPCHTTGYRFKGGFTSSETTPHLTNVQCESCHGPGVAHSRRPTKGYGLVTKNTCMPCHDRANSPGFDYDVYRNRILHGKSSGGGTPIIPAAK